MRPPDTLATSRCINSWPRMYARKGRGLFQIVRLKQNHRNQSAAPSENMRNSCDFQNGASAGWLREGLNAAKSAVVKIHANGIRLRPTRKFQSRGLNFREAGPGSSISPHSSAAQAAS